MSVGPGSAWDRLGLGYTTHTTVSSITTVSDVSGMTTATTFYSLIFYFVLAIVSVMCYSLDMRKQCQQCGRTFYDAGQDVDCCPECCNGKDALECEGCETNEQDIEQHNST